MGKPQHGNNKIVKSEDDMKYKNVEIGDRPTKEQFKEYDSRMGYILEVE